MAGKSGRLVFCEHGGIQRKEYQAVAIYQDGIYQGHAAICPCALGDHFLALTSMNAAIERTVSGRESPFIFFDASAALWAIEKWRQQEAYWASVSGESEAE